MRPPASASPDPVAPLLKGTSAPTAELFLDHNKQACDLFHFTLGPELGPRKSLQDDYSSLRHTVDSGPSNNITGSDRVYVVELNGHYVLICHPVLLNAAAASRNHQETSLKRPCTAAEPAVGTSDPQRHGCFA